MKTATLPGAVQANIAGSVTDRKLRNLAIKISNCLNPKADRSIPIKCHFAHFIMLFVMSIGLSKVTLGQSTGLLSPSTNFNVNSVDNVNNGYASDNQYAVFNNMVTMQHMVILIFQFLQRRSTIVGIEVMVEGNRPSGGGRDFDINLTWNNGSSYTAITNYTSVWYFRCG